MKTLNNLLTGVIGIVIAMLVGALFIKSQDNSPVQVYRALCDYGLGSWFSFSSTLNSATPLILTGMSAAIAFSAGVINLGQHGQFTVGALTAALLGVYLPLPGWIGIPVILLVSGIAAGLWGVIAGLLKRFYRMNELITTLMLNFIAEYLALYLAMYLFLDKSSYVPATKMVNSEFFIHSHNNLSMGFFIAIGMVVLSYVLVSHFKIGYEWRMMGHNLKFARVGGCETDENVIWIMIYTGFLSGLGGALLILGGTQHRFMRGIAGNFGWDGIMLSIIGNSGVIATSLFAIFFGFLKAGGIGMEFETGVPSEFVLVLQAVIVLMVVSTRSIIYFYGDRIRARIKVREVVKG